MSRHPLRVTGDQWNDVRHHYQDADYLDLPRMCPECGDEYPDDGEACCPECIQPAPDEHLESDYDERNGDIEPPF